MAKSKKESNAPKSEKTEVADAEIVEETTSESPSDAQDTGKEDIPATSDETIEAADPSDAATEIPDPVEATNIPSDPLSDDAAHDAEPPASPFETSPPAAEPETDTPQSSDVSLAATTPEPSSSSSGFAGFVTGGVIAAALGFLGAQYSNDGWPFGAGGPDVGAIEARVVADLAQIRSDVDAAAASADAAVQPGDLAVLEDGQAGLRTKLSDMTALLDGLTTDLDALASRLDTLEKRPIAEGVSENAIAAYERELDALRAAIAAQRTEVEEMAENAAAMEESAEETARRTMARAAVARIRNAIDTGESFSTAIEDLQASGVTPPAILIDASDGDVATRASLAASFPDAARAALRAWRADASENGGSGNKIGNFLRDQLGVRSVTPREGDDPDAILSRAEAAISEGRIADALAEIEGLPPSARQAVDGWESDARRRMDVRAAADELAQSLSQG